MALRYVQMATGEMFTLGVDLATEAKHTGVCCLRWDSNGVEVVAVSGQATNDDILRLAEGCAAVGIDAPFGWPTPWSEAVGRFRPGRAFEASGKTAELTSRNTDRFVHDKTGALPMAVAANLIGATAIRAVRLVHRLCSEGFALDLGAPPPSVPLVSEVYPAAALRVWRMPHTKYKGQLWTANCAPFIARLTVPLGLECDPRRQPSLYASDNAFDAFVASLVARAVVCGDTLDAPASYVEPAAAEGWIRIPGRDSTLGGLLGQS